MFLERFLSPMRGRHLRFSDAVWALRAATAARSLSTATWHQLSMRRSGHRRSSRAFPSANRSWTIPGVSARTPLPPVATGVTTRRSVYALAPRVWATSCTRLTRRVRGRLCSSCTVVTPRVTAARTRPAGGRVASVPARPQRERLPGYGRGPGIAGQCRRVDLLGGGADARAALVDHHLRLWGVGDGRWCAICRHDRSRRSATHDPGGPFPGWRGRRAPRDDPSKRCAMESARSCLLAPTAFVYQPVLGIPPAVLLSTCDGDVSDLEGQLYIDRGRDVGPW